MSGIDKTDLLERIEGCINNAEHDDEQETLIDARGYIEALSAENKRLCEALAFYARENSWKSCGMYMSGRPNPSPAEIDKGGKASAALKARGLEIREKNDD